MKFAVGYQLAEPDEESFVDIVHEFRDHIGEVYFPWIGHPSGRSPIGMRGRCSGEAARERLESELLSLKSMGVKLDLLLNANCYGGAAMSRELEAEVSGLIEHLVAIGAGVDVVTTTSPAIAHMVRELFPDVDRRASVNMRIGTVQGMEYVADLFDSFYVQRDVNRDIEHLRGLRTWADGHGKELCMLVNSGCFRYCSGQTFHDNLVAHEPDVAASENIDGFMPYTCWRHLADRQNWPAVLQSTWVRPEDLHHYEGIFDVFKLATRLHERPWIVLRAYASGRFHGNLLDLFEPGYSPAFAPCVVDNSRFPSDWFERTTACGGHCTGCCYCADVLEQALVDLSA